MTTNLDLDALEALCHRANAEGNTFDDRLAFMDEACAAIPELLRMARENHELNYKLNDARTVSGRCAKLAIENDEELTILRAANLAAQKLIGEGRKALAKAAEDAARYRWIRLGDNIGPRTMQMQYHHVEHLDAAIDAAMQEKV